MTQGADNQQATSPISQVGARAWSLADQAAGPATWANGLVARRRFGAGGLLARSLASARYIRRWLDVRPADLTLLRRLPESEADEQPDDMGAWLRRAEMFEAGAASSGVGARQAAAGPRDAATSAGSPASPRPLPRVAPEGPAASAQRLPAPELLAPALPRVAPEPSAAQGRAAAGPAPAALPGAAPAAAGVGPMRAAAPATGSPLAQRDTAHGGERAGAAPASAGVGMAAPPSPILVPQGPRFGEGEAAASTSSEPLGGSAAAASPLLAPIAQRASFAQRVAAPGAALPLVMRAPAAPPASEGAPSSQPQAPSSSTGGGPSLGEAEARVALGASRAAPDSGQSTVAGAPRDGAPLQRVHLSPPEARSFSQPAPSYEPIGSSSRPAARPSFDEAGAPVLRTAAATGSQPAGAHRAAEAAGASVGPELPFLTPILQRAGFAAPAATLPAPLRRALASDAPAAERASPEDTVAPRLQSGAARSAAPAPLLLMRARPAEHSDSSATPSGETPRAGTVSRAARSPVVPALDAGWPDDAPDTPMPSPAGAPALVGAPLAGRSMTQRPALHQPTPAEGVETMAEAASDEVTRAAQGTGVARGSGAAGGARAPAPLVQLAPVAARQAAQPAPGALGLAADAAAGRILRRLAEPGAASSLATGVEAGPGLAPSAAQGPGSPASLAPWLGGDVPALSPATVPVQPASAGAPLPLIRRELGAPAPRPLDSQPANQPAPAGTWTNGPEAGLRQPQRLGQPARSSGYPEPGSLSGAQLGDAQPWLAPAPAAAPDLLRPIAPVQRAPDSAVTSAASAPATPPGTVQGATVESGTGAQAQQAAPEVDIDAIAQKVYEQLRRRLRIDQERLGKY